MPKRPSWDSYFMRIAEIVSERSTCDKLHVGAVIVKDRNILATGFNGSISGDDHCCDVGCLINAEKKCVRTVHAEINAIAQAAKHGVSIDGSTMYVTTLPCWTCFKVLINAGIKKIVYGKTYSHSEDVDLVTKTAWRLDIPIEKYEEEQF